MADRLKQRNRAPRNRVQESRQAMMARHGVSRTPPAPPGSSTIPPAVSSAVNTLLQPVGWGLWGLDTFAAGVGSAVNTLTGGDPSNPLSVEGRVLPGEAIRRNVFGIEKGNLATTLAELPIDILLDPLTYGGPGGFMKSVGSKGANALRKIGKFDDIARVASRKLADDAVQAARKAAPISRKKNALQVAADMDATLSPGGNALDAAIAANKASKKRVDRVLQDAGQTVDKYNTFRSRPLVGNNVGMRMFNTLDDFLNSARKTEGNQYADDLIQKLQQGVTPEAYDDLLKSRVGGDNFGFDVFGFNPRFNLPGSMADKYAGGLDNLRDIARYGQLGTRYSRRFDRDTTTTSAAAQALQREAAMAGREFKQIATGQTRALTRELHDLIDSAGLPPETIQDPKFMEAVDRLLEGNAASLDDLQLVKSIPGMNRWLTKYHRVNKDILAGSKRAGVQADQLADPFGNKYRSYSGMNTPFYDVDGGTARTTAFTSAFDTTSQSMRKRAESFRLPGGLDQRRYILRNYNDILERAYPGVPQSSLTHREVTDALYADITRNTNGATNYYDFIPGSPLAKSKDPLMGYDPKQVYKNVNRMVETLRQQVTDTNKLTEDSLKGLSQSPLESMATNAPQRMGNVGVGNVLTNELAASAQLKRAKDLPLVGPDAAIPLMKARGKLRLMGKDNRMELQRLLAEEASNRTGRRVRPEDIDLNNYSIPRSRLDLYSAATTYKKEALDSAKEALDNPTIMNAISSGSGKGRTGWILDHNVKKFKAMILSYPAKYVRDLTSSVSMNAMHHGIDDLAPSYIDANRIMNGDFDWVADQLNNGVIKGYDQYGSRADKLKAFIRDLDTYDPLSQGSGMGYASELGVNKNVLSNTIGMEPRGLISPSGTKFSDSTFMNLMKTLDPTNTLEVLWKRDLDGTKLTELADILNTKFDGTNRMASVFASMRNGVPMEEAVRIANDLHVRYDNLSDTEKQIRRFIPFMSYDRGMRNTQLTQALTKPGSTYMQLLRARERSQGREDNEVYTPQYIKDGTGGALPSALSDPLNRITGRPEDTAWYIQNLDFPGAAAWDYGGIVNANPDNPFTFENLLDSTVASLDYTKDKVIGKVAPQVKGPIEASSNHDSFRMRDGIGPGPIASTYLNMYSRLNGADAANEEYKRLRDKEYYKYESLLNVLPAVSGTSRLQRLAEQLTDPGTVGEQAGQPARPIYNNVLETMFNTVAPFKLKSQTPMQQTRAARGDLDQSLRRMGIGRRSRAMKNDHKHGPIMRRAIQTERLLKKNLENME